MQSVCHCARAGSEQIRLRPCATGLAEYGWKPLYLYNMLYLENVLFICIWTDRVVSIFFGSKKAYHRPHSTSIRVERRGVRFHRIRDFKQYYFNCIPPTSHCGFFVRECYVRARDPLRPPCDTFSSLTTLHSSPLTSLHCTATLCFASTRSPCIHPDKRKPCAPACASSAMMPCARRKDDGHL